MHQRSKIFIQFCAFVIVGGALLGCQPSVIESGQNQRSQAIVNGKPMEKSDELGRSTVTLYYQNRPVADEADAKTNLLFGAFCGGTLIADDMILTAAHCLRDFAQDMKFPEGELKNRIRIGFGNDVAEGPFDSRVQLIDISEILIHPKYKKIDTSKTVSELIQEDHFDIAVIQLKKSAPAFAKVLSMNARIRPQSGESVTVAGTGLTKSLFGFEKSKLMQKAEMTFVGQSVSTLLILNPLNGQSVCNADSGGPVVYQDLLIGVVSFAGVEGYGRCAGPLASISVLAMRDWIQNAIDTLRFGESAR